MPEVTPATKSTCDESQKPLAGDALAGEMKGVTNQPEKPVGRKRGGSGGLVTRPRDRMAEKEQQKLRHSLGLPSVGKQAESIRKQVAGFRRATEAAVIVARGGISLSDACAVATACTAQRHSLLAAMWLRKDDGKLSSSEKLALAKSVLEGSEKRDKAVASLRLPGGATDHAGGNHADFYAQLAKDDIEHRPEEVTPAAASPTEPDGPAPLPLAPPAAVVIHSEHPETVPLEDL